MSWNSGQEFSKIFPPFVFRSCFPTTIINRVLMCGLKEYYIMLSEGKDDKQKVTSVVGILSHLASQHSHDIRKALMALFKVSGL